MLVGDHPMGIAHDEQLRLEANELAGNPGRRVLNPPGNDGADLVGKSLTNARTLSPALIGRQESDDRSRDLAITILPRRVPRQVIRADACLARSRSRTNQPVAALGPSPIKP